MIRRKESDDRLRIDGGNTQKAVKDRRSSAGIARLHDKGFPWLTSKDRSVEGLVHAIDDIKRPLVGQLQCRPSLRFLEQSGTAENGAELFGPLVAGNLAGQGFQTSAVAAGQNNRPLML